MHFGGCRQWFASRPCWRRCRILYGGVRSSDERVCDIRWRLRGSPEGARWKFRRSLGLKDRAPSWSVGGHVKRGAFFADLAQEEVYIIDVRKVRLESGMHSSLKRFAGGTGAQVRITFERHALRGVPSVMLSGGRSPW